MPDTETAEATTVDNTDETTDDTIEATTNEDAAADDTTDTETDVDEDQADQDDGDTFPAEYVRKLRSQNARYRERAKAAEGYAQRLHTELVRATGRLADPTDLEFDDAHLEDPDTLITAIDELLERKPHLASRKPVGDIGQGQRGAAGEPFSLLSLLKQRT